MLACRNTENRQEYEKIGLFIKVAGESKRILKNCRYWRNGGYYAEIRAAL